MFAASQLMKVQTAETAATATGSEPPPNEDARPASVDHSGPSNSATGEWTRLVERIRCGEEAAMEDLYRVFSKGIRFYLCRQLGTQELDDRVHDTFLIVVQAIQRGDLREPERLMGFVRTIVRRQVAAYISDAVQARRDHADLEAGSKVIDGAANPEETAIERQTTDLMKKVLRSVSERDREILTRFYLREESQEKICEVMNLSETQFRLLKSRAKARFGELGRKKVTRAGLPGLLMRRNATGEH